MNHSRRRLKNESEFISRKCRRGVAAWRRRITESSFWCVSANDKFYGCESVLRLFHLPLVRETHRNIKMQCRRTRIDRVNNRSKRNFCYMHLLKLYKRIEEQTRSSIDCVTNSGENNLHFSIRSHLTCIWWFHGSVRAVQQGRFAQEEMRKKSWILRLCSTK